MKIDRRKLLMRARALGADIAGVTDIEGLIEAGAILHEPLPAARSAIVLGVRQSFTALDSSVIQMAQHDTLYAYSKVDCACHGLARTLEDAGYASIAIPSFLPIDMGDEIQGMVGEVDHRRAAVEAGLGVYGLNNLLFTELFGPRVRLATVLTTAPIAPNRPLRKKLCDECGRCAEACPAGALDEPGKTDKRACGRVVFEHGLRGLMRFVFKWTESDARQRDALLKSRTFRELWQNFMTGMYYTCFACQAACPAGSARPSKERKGVWK
jgi:epoxyqueuosine reductase